MRRTSLVLALLLCGVPARAQEPQARLTGKPSASPGEVVILSTAGTVSDTPPFVKLDSGPAGAVVKVSPLYTSDGKGGFAYVGGMVVIPAQPGRYTFECVAISLNDEGAPADADATTFTIAAGVDPGPTPTPTPAPTPTPTPTPTPEPPVPAWGPLARILILYESEKLTGREAFYSTDVTDALSRVAPVGSDGRPAWRIWDDDLPTDGEPSWADAMARARAAFTDPSVPVLVAFDQQGRTKPYQLSSYATPELMVTLINSLGGPGLGR